MRSVTGWTRTEPDDCFQASRRLGHPSADGAGAGPRAGRAARPGEDLEEISRSSWERIDRWASKRGLTAMIHDEDEVPAPRRRWIGVIVSPNTGTTIVEDGRVLGIDDDQPGLNDHCLVMSHDRLVFDPSCSVRLPPGTEVMTYRPTQITYGISFDKEE